MIVITRAWLAPVVAVGLALVVPFTAFGTTGTQTDLKELVTLTDKGVVWRPALHRRTATTGTTVKLHVVNKASQPHWFAIGKRKTKPLAAGGGSATFFYSFTKPGTVIWRTGMGDVAGPAFHGAFKVVFPPHFH